MDFVKPHAYESKKGGDKVETVVSPLFERINEDAVSKGGKLNAYWNGERWVSVEQSDTQLLQDINRQVKQYAREHFPGRNDVTTHSVSLIPAVSKEYERFVKNYKGNSHILFNRTIFFKSDKPQRDDYSTFQLDYDPVEGATPVFDKMMNKWYTDGDTQTLLWFIGAALTNNMQDIQKFLFIYGSGGSGKGSFLNILDNVFEEYAQSISLKKLASNSQFANSEVKDIPVLIDGETDLSRIENKENFLSLTAHEEIWVEKKGKDPYPVRFQGLLVTASNKPYDMGNAKSGLGRRVVAVYPTGEKFATNEYYDLMKQVKFETPYIAQRAIDTFNRLGIEYVNNLNEDYRMRMETDDMFNFIRENVRHGVFKKDMTTLTIAKNAYREYLESNGLSIKNHKNRIKNELMNYYNGYEEEKRVDGRKLYSVYTNLKMDMVFPEEYGNRDQSDREKEETASYNSSYNIFADSDFLAQYAGKDGNPTKKWANVNTPVSDLDQTKLHFVRMPTNRIRIDFDKPTLEENIECTKLYPPTYGEVSKSGKGIHLHYIYDGDVSELDTKKHNDIEVKVSTGNSSVRRKFSRSNGLELSSISSGLPKKEKKVIEDIKEYVTTEKTMRNEVQKALRKEHHGATKPEVDFIYKILTDAKEQGVKYDLSDMKQDVFIFALNSTNQSAEALKMVKKMPFANLETDIIDPQNISYGDEFEGDSSTRVVPNEDLYFFDVEVFKNIFMVSWHRFGEKSQTWINPTQAEIEWLIKKPLVGFNNRKYDNHIMYAAMLGYSNYELYETSSRIVSGDKDASFPAAYSLAYADVYDFANTKQSLKKWEVELGLPYDELEIDWNEPLPDDLKDRVAEYNRNDDQATEKVFKHLESDYDARVVLAELTDSPISDTTNQLSAKFLFGNDKSPQDKFIYTDLSEKFPGYTHGWKTTEVKKRDGSVTTKKTMRSEYRGEDPSEGGYVYSNPGVYKNVWELDIRSMHPNSLINLNYFGPYTERFARLVDARGHIKHIENRDGTIDNEQRKEAIELLPEVKPYLEDGANYSGLAYALKIVVNSVYGMTSAKFPNKFKHPDNDDNIIAKRGALFMIDLKNACIDEGYEVVHIKTDSIKIANCDEDTYEFVKKFADDYGYDIEIAGQYDRMALINKAVLIAHYDPKYSGQENLWHAIGKEFSVPYIFKTLFSHEALEQSDYWVTKEAKAGPMYLGEDFVGRIGSFYASNTGQELVWVKDDKRHAVTGTKDFLWRKSGEFVNKYDIDQAYYDDQVATAIRDIKKVGDITELIEVPDVFKSV